MKNELFRQSHDSHRVSSGDDPILRSDEQWDRVVADGKVDYNAGWTGSQGGAVDIQRGCGLICLRIDRKAGGAEWHGGNVVRNLALENGRERSVIQSQGGQAREVAGGEGLVTAIRRTTRIDSFHTEVIDGVRQQIHDVTARHRNVAASDGRRRSSDRRSISSREAVFERYHGVRTIGPYVGVQRRRCVGDGGRSQGCCKRLWWSGREGEAVAAERTGRARNESLATCQTRRAHGQRLAAE